ncbi:FtsH protease activity modulator HflK [uncultured Shimia sp.]|uniref:FtsH protease activity modulator HflK n=1 Tax=uncultured Shimia sp. TaxID=573152 RepID=UPI00261F9B8C|nr:FtsH protease activity modulator HflK [uncultured Shimia sp.]
MAGNSGGPWGGGGNNQGGGNQGGGNRGNNNGGGRRPPEGDGPQIPDIDDLMKKGQDQLKVLMGGRGGQGGGSQNGSGQGGAGGPGLNKGTVAIGALVAAGLWAFSSFYSVKPEEKSVELFLGEYYATGEPGLNFAPWPFVTAEVLPVTNEQTEEIPGRGTDGLMLTGDENIVDIDYQVVWNISDPAQFLFNLRDPRETIRAVSESAMREIIAQSELAPILNRDRGVIADRLQESIQSTLDTYNSGVNIVRVNFDGADPPEEVKDAFREVQSASQERDRLEKQADAYSNRVTAGARGEAAQILEEAEAYRAQVVNEAEGEASRFSAVLTEYQKAPEVTRKRLYLETMEEVLGDIDKVIIDEQSGGSGVVPYLPLNELRKGSN